MKENIHMKLKAKDPNDIEVVEANPQLVTPFMSLFEKLFIWEPGKYVAKLKVDKEYKSASFSTKYQFMLYESDSAKLKSKLKITNLVVENFSTSIIMLGYSSPYQDMKANA